MMEEVNYTTTYHLDHRTWSLVSKRLIGKAISEFAHERIIEPICIEESAIHWTRYTLTTDRPEVTYSFKGIIRELDHWHIDLNSIKRIVKGEEAPLDVCQFILELKDTVNIPEDLLPTYLEEITATLQSLVFKETHESVSSKEMIRAGFQTIEHAMKEGHPCFVANSGRVGFDATAYQKYAPECNQPFPIVWLAAHKSRASFHCIKEITYEQVMNQELGQKAIAYFNHQLVSKGLNPESYYFLPVHPWQWTHKICTLFAQDIANELLVFMGNGPSHYLAQQSIRTLFNHSHPEKYYVKTALSILNMGFVRGLSPYYMESTPPITEWINERLAKDPVLDACGFEMLGEVATIGYRNVLYESLGKKLPQNKMLSALWRESPIPRFKSGQQLATMASLLHIDQFNHSFLVESIKASKMHEEEWISSYLHCYLKPLIHCFYTYELVFMPHGENVILVLEKHVPVRAIMKDITEEVIVFDEGVKLTGHAARLQKQTTDEMKLTYIFTDVFDCFFRFLSNILVTYGKYPESLFWEQVASCIRTYQKEHPEMESQFERYDFFQPTFKRCCLNRLQLQNTKQMLNLDDPMGSLQWAGTIKNPIYKYK